MKSLRLSELILALKEHDSTLKVYPPKKGFDDRSIEALTDAIEVNAVCSDSREVDAGALFVALKGAQTDGHDFVDEVLRRNPVAVLVEHGRYERAAAAAWVISCSNSRAALAVAAARFYGNPSEAIKMIGITGTNGKTTCAHITAALLRQKPCSVGLIGTVGYSWIGHWEEAVNTTPGSLQFQRLLGQMRRDGVEVAVSEISSHALVTHRVDEIVFDVAVFTNLSQDHLDFHGSMQAYRDAKARLFLHHLCKAREKGKRPVAIINGDDQEGRRLCEKLAEMGGIRVIRYGMEYSDLDLRVRRSAIQKQGMMFEVQWEGEVREGTCQMLGQYNLYNCAAALATVHVLGMPWSSALSALGQVTAPVGRMQRVSSDGPAIYIDYAHTPDALERALRSLRELNPARLVVVFGCGGNRDRQKRPEMGRVASELADVVVLTSDNPRNEEPLAIIDEICAGMISGASGCGLPGLSEGWILIEPDRRKAIDRAIRGVGPRDVTLIAGKGHEKYQVIGGQQLPFDDQQEALRALRRRKELPIEFELEGTAKWFKSE